MKSQAKFLSRASFYIQPLPFRCILGNGRGNSSVILEGNPHDSSIRTKRYWCKEFTLTATRTMNTISRGGTGMQGTCNGGWIADGLGWKGGPKDLFLRIALEIHRAVSRVSRLADPKGLVFTPSILGGLRPAAILGTRRGMPLARVEVEKPVESNQN